MGGGGLYVELDYDVIDTIIHQFGNNYEIKKTDFWEFYTWEKIRVSAIDISAHYVPISINLQPGSFVYFNIWFFDKQH